MITKLRKALEDSNELLRNLGVILGESDLVTKRIAENNSVLTEPLRNCDVGTAEEQVKRFKEFCNEGYKNCGSCPLYTSGTIEEYCELRWSQLPYEKGKT